VRTESFGYYGTRWRRWPGTGVVPASAIEGATPVPAPRSTVPRADEESPDTGAGAEDSERGDPQQDATGDAAGVRLPSAPGIDIPTAVGEPPVPTGANDNRQPTGWRRWLVDGAISPTSFFSPAAARAAGPDARPAPPSRQPADAAAGRGR
jgi:hypothetical protein